VSLLIPLPFLDIPIPSTAPEWGGFLGHRITIGTIFEIHILISGAVSGLTQLGPISEWIGYFRGRKEYDRLAHGTAHVLIYIFAFGAFTAILPVTILLVVLWGHLWSIITMITFWPFMIESGSFLAMVATVYIWYYTWPQLEGRFKPLHMMVGGILVIASFVQVLMIDIVASYMLTPTAPLQPFQVFLNPTEVPLQAHRLVANLAYAGYAFAAVGAFHLLWRRGKSPEDLAHFDWMTSFGMIWGTLLTLLQPAVGWSYAKEIQLHAYGSWYKMMLGDLSPAFLLQIFLLGLIFFVPQFYFDRRMTRSGARGTGVMRVLTILLAVTTVFAVLPSHFAFTFDQVQAEGMNRPFWEGGLLNPFGYMIPYKIAALTAMFVFSVTGLWLYMRSRRALDFSPLTASRQRWWEKTIPIVSLFLVMTMIVLMGFIRENGRFPDGIAGQVQLHGQQSIDQQGLNGEGLSGGFP
jgi:hypothetical protein